MGQSVFADQISISGSASNLQEAMDDGKIGPGTGTNFWTPGDFAAPAYLGVFICTKSGTLNKIWIISAFSADATILIGKNGDIENPIATCTYLYDHDESTSLQSFDTISDPDFVEGDFLLLYLSDEGAGLSGLALTLDTIGII